MAKVKLAFNALNIAAKRQFVAKVVQMTTGNPNFPGAASYLTALTTGDSELGTATTDADAKRAASKIATSAQNAKEKALDSAMSRFGTFIELTANGDADKILSSGLAVQSDPTAAVIPDAPHNLSLSRGDDGGEIHGHFDALANADSYLSRWCVGDGPNGPWTIVPAPFKKSNFDTAGLASGSHVWVEVSASNAAGTSPWSNASDIYVP